MTKALIVVDVQRDFCEGGSLAVAGGADVATKITEFVQAHRKDYKTVVATRDSHINPGAHFADEPDYKDTWPAHCVAGTTGEWFHPNLKVTFHCTFRKGQYDAAYSGFEGESLGLSLEGWLRTCEVDEVDVVGIATDYCVKATALDAAARGFKTNVLLDLTAAVAPDKLQSTLDEFKDAGVEVVS